MLISCKAIKPLYDSSEDNLVPFLTKLELCRQHEGWASATFVTVAGKKYDLTTHFSLLTEADMQAATTDHWSSPDAEKDKHTVGHPTYNARLLSIVLMSSITDDFMTTLIHKVPTALHNNGTYLLWSVSHNIHHNNIAFHEHIREKICTATILEHDNDITKYIITIKNYLKMITPLSGSTSAENGLLTYILRQLKLCNAHLFQEYIHTLHVAFQEGKHSNMTPTSLLSKVEDKIRALKHASEWTLDESVATPAMALVTTSSTTSSLEELLKQQIALISKLLEAQKGGSGQKLTTTGNTKLRLISITYVATTVKFFVGAQSATAAKASGLQLMTPERMLMDSNMTAIKTMAVATPIDKPVVADHLPTPPLSHRMTTYPI